MRWPGRGTVSDKQALRVVFDTNVVVSALIFTSSATSRLRAAWNSGTFIPLASTSTVQELLHVFAYPKFRLSERDAEELLSDYIPFLEMVDLPDGIRAPSCADHDDHPFADLAVGAGAHAIVTGDRHLHDLSTDLSIPVLTVTELFARYHS